MIPNSYRCVAGAQDEGKRLDTFLSETCDLSRARLQQLIAEGHVTVNGLQVGKARRVKAGDRAEVDIPAPVKSELVPEQMTIRVLYEDDDLIVLSKPAGVVVHPGPGHPTGTLVHGLLARAGGLSSIGGMERPGIVHRLDRDTSGLMIVAKTDLAHQRLAADLKAHRVKRTYWALVHGRLGQDEGEIVAPIGRHPRHRRKMAVNEAAGRRAVTHYRVLERFDPLTLLEVKPETGRTHQIRVHLAHVGHPVAGDADYGSDKKKDRELGLTRQFLHAVALEFKHSRTGETVTVSDALPADLQAALKRLG